MNILEAPLLMACILPILAFLLKTHLCAFMESKDERMAWFIVADVFFLVFIITMINVWLWK